MHSQSIGSASYAGSRLRTVRLLERLGEIGSALELAALVREQPADEVEAQQLSRMWPRLQRKAGLKSRTGPASARAGPHSNSCCR